MHHGPLLPENVEKGAWGNSFPAQEDEQALLSHAHDRIQYRIFGRSGRRFAAALGAQELPGHRRVPRRGWHCHKNVAGHGCGPTYHRANIQRRVDLAIDAPKGPGDVP
jgi:hypothetical protein